MVGNGRHCGFLELLHCNNARESASDPCPGTRYAVMRCACKENDHVHTQGSTRAAQGRYAIRGRDPARQWQARLLRSRDRRRPRQRLGCGRRQRRRGFRQRRRHRRRLSADRAQR
ncbi:DUF2890 domain-containing protein [Sphingomonas populi]|uniref:DUF2890 domain-containing protein n=1 Tax=Sphingomonas populi TaxID=2484750 RepID=A0A4V2DD16_9SPHN|nr:DUF2890 domain-containing protein [Sphingomonas populi]